MQPGLSAYTVVGSSLDLFCFHCTSPSVPE
jgi:hypothetical protein